MRDCTRPGAVRDPFELANLSLKLTDGVFLSRQEVVECRSRREMEQFVSARDALPGHLKGFIVPYSTEEYVSAGARLFVTRDGLGGVAVIKGELASLFSLPGTCYGDLLVCHAVRHGAYKLSCFDTRGKLPALYGRHGFVETFRAAWDDTLAPANWSCEHWGRPDYVEMRR